MGALPKAGHADNASDEQTERFVLADAERRLRILAREDLRDELGRLPNPLILGWHMVDSARAGRTPVLGQLRTGDKGELLLDANEINGASISIPLVPRDTPGRQIEVALAELQARLERPIVVFPHGVLTSYLRQIEAPPEVEFGLLSYFPTLSVAARGRTRRQGVDHTRAGHTSHLDRLEAEAIHILREALACARKPVMLYSVGKDSSVMLHLARKAFYPAPPPLPLLHVDTRWKFREMYLFRDHIVNTLGLELLTHTNPEAVHRNINPFDHGSALHTDITKTQALRQALDLHRFDVVFGGARRDEEKSRAKERIFSVRNAGHGWDPKNQRPEMWDLYNVATRTGESLRVFPLSNWTELDVWQYIYRENIPVVPLYFAKERAVVRRDGMLLVIDDERMRLAPTDQIERRVVRFRTLGCYPLTGAVESSAASVGDIILELMRETQSERQGRSIDADTPGSMEKKKREGYF